MSASTSTAAAESADLGGRLRSLRPLWLFAELAALSVVVEQTRVISPAFVLLFHIAVVGAFLHGILPTALRPAFFLALSFAAAVVTLQWLPAVVLFAAGLVLIGICHLPLRLAVRVSLLVACGGIAVGYRAGVDALPELPIEILLVLPILASMFMFRITIFLYDREKGSQQSDFVQTLNYFFMLPNVCFPLFPVVDFTTFLRSRREGELWEVQQKGIYWIVEGTIHLLLLRLIEVYVLRDPYELESRLDHLLYLVSAYALYLRVSGQFHIAIGLLQLFGYDLPRTHNRYFLASSFSELWRRINIYWMEYMRKMVYFPVALRLRRLGEPWTSGLATVSVFLCTLVLHSYQLFWLSGSFRITARDVVFWGLLCLFVLVDMQRERRALARRRRDAQTPRDARVAPWMHGLRVFVTLAIMTLLWSLWSSEGIPFGHWLAIVRAGVLP